MLVSPNIGDAADWIFLKLWGLAHISIAFTLFQKQLHRYDFSYELNILITTFPTWQVLIISKITHKPQCFTVFVCLFVFFILSFKPTAHEI